MGVATPACVTLPVTSRACAATAASGATVRKTESDAANRRRTDAPRSERDGGVFWASDFGGHFRPQKTIAVSAIPLTPVMAIQPDSGPLRHTTVTDVARRVTACQERC